MTVEVASHGHQILTIRSSIIESAGEPDSEPVSIVDPEPPVAAGQGSGCPAHRTKPLGTQGSARSDVEHGMGRGAVSPLGSGARTIPVQDLVVGRATAESPGAGCGAGRDRMTRVLRRSWSVSRWRRGIRAWGRDQPATDEPAAGAAHDPLQGGPDIPAVHDDCFPCVRSHGCRHLAGSTTPRAGRVGRLTSPRWLLGEAALPVVPPSIEPGPGSSAVPLGYGRPFT